MDKEQLREWAQKVSQEGGKMGRIEVDFDSVKAAADYIKETMPEPTMDEIGWSDDKHQGVVARGSDGEELVMLWPSTSGDTIYCLDLITKSLHWEWDDELTPTGERYIRQGENDGTQ